MTPSPDSRVTTGLAAVAGSVAGGAALAAGELPSGVARRPVSPITGVSNEFVDRFAGALKDLAVSLFGQGDKTALIVGVVVVSLAVGAGLGVVAVRRFWLAAAGFLAFGALGVWASLTDPRSDTALSWVSAAIAVATGVAVLALLLRLLPEQRVTVGQSARTLAPARTATAPARAATVPAGGADRRAFLAWAGAVAGTAALAGVAGRALRNRANVAAERLALRLPTPRRRAAVPTTGLVEVEGVSPYITPTADFYRIDTALVTPQVPVDPWRLSVTGLVDEPFELTFDELVAMDLVEEAVTIACVSNEIGGDLVGNAVWLGVPLVDLLDRAGLQPDATQIIGRSVDGFTAGFPTDAALDGRVAMVAVGMNGEPLPARHGYPGRLVVTGLYGYVSATKWLTEIELTRFEDVDGYWIPRGWAKEAPIKTQSRIDVPRGRAALAAGIQPIAGVAWAPGTGITGVEVQVDDGPWEPAELGAAVGATTWVQWVHRWDADPGDHTLRVRATDANGVTQTAERTRPAPDGASGHHTLSVSVSS